LFDKKIVLSTLTQLINSCNLISERFVGIDSSDDFLTSKSGLIVLDSICMQLVAIGQGIKNLDKNTEGKLLIKYQDVDWKGAMGMRDIMSHNYFDVDSEIVFDVCKTKIIPLRNTLEKILSAL